MKNGVKFMDNKEIQHSKPTIEDNDIKEVEKVLLSNFIARGNKVVEFENQLAEYIRGGKAYATSSGSSALFLALFGLELEPQDEIIIPTYVCKSVMDAVKFANARPIIVDVGDDYCISASEIKRNFTKHTKAIIVVHMYGISAKIKEIIDVAKEYEIYVIEDCAQSIGGEINGRKLGSFGDLAIFSFHATKVITCGEGGMLLINNRKLLLSFEKKISTLCDRFFTMTDIQAAIGLCQLRKLPELLEKRRYLAQKYIELLEDLPNILIPINDIQRSIFFRFPVRIRKNFDFDNLRRKMEGYGIHIRKGVDLMLHQLENNFKCPNADVLFKETVSLPIYPRLDLCYVEEIVARFKEVLYKEGIING